MGSRSSDGRSRRSDQGCRGGSVDSGGPCFLFCMCTQSSWVGLVSCFRFASRTGSRSSKRSLRLATGDLLFTGIVDMFRKLAKWRQPFCNRQTSAHFQADETKIRKTPTSRPSHAATHRGICLSEAVSSLNPRDRWFCRRDLSDQPPPTRKEAGQPRFCFAAKKISKIASRFPVVFGKAHDSSCEIGWEVPAGRCSCRFSGVVQ